MADEVYHFRLVACRELMDSHPESLVIRQQVEALEDALPDKPGIAVSFCRTLIETTCRTILIDRGQIPDQGWEAPKLIAETTKFLHLGIHDDGYTDADLREGAGKLVRGVNSIVDGVVHQKRLRFSGAWLGRLRPHARCPLRRNPSASHRRSRRRAVQDAPQRLWKSPADAPALWRSQGFRRMDRYWLRTV